MSKKRKLSSATFLPPSDFTKHRRHPALDGDDDEGNGTKAAQPKVDQTYGQRGAFPGLDDGEDGQLFYGPASDGLEYLRMVRSEAKSVPTLLVAPTPHHDQDYKIEDQPASYAQGYYADGAYTAAPLPPTSSSTSPTSSGSDIHPQEAYHTSLCTRFASHSTHLQHPPPNLAPPPSILPIAPTLPYHWRKLLQTTPPSMSLLASLSQEAVLHGLRIIEAGLSEGYLRRNGNLGVWIWGLLGRCRDVGEMGSEEVGVLRELGKKAIWVLRGVQAGVVGAEEGEAEGEGGSGDDEGEEGGVYGEERVGFGDGEEDATAGADEASGEMEDGHDSLEAVKARMLASLPAESLETDPNSDDPVGTQTPILHASQSETPPPAPDGTDEQTTKLHATLDMIITIVGEFYGQRDLLAGRVSWGER